MFERFTEGARRVVVYAQEECRLLWHEHIGTEHLLLGLLHDDTATAAALGEVGVTLVGARDRIEHSFGRGTQEFDGHIPFTLRAKQVLELSLRHAQRLGQDHVAEPHLLLALLGVRDSVAVGCLVDWAVDLDVLTTRVDGLASTTDPDGGLIPSAGEPPVSAGRPGRRLRRLHYRPDPEASDDLAAQSSDVGQRAALANALRRYGRHDEACDRTRGCTCGLQSVLDDLDPPGAAPGPDQ